MEEWPRWNLWRSGLGGTCGGVAYVAKFALNTRYGQVRVEEPHGQVSMDIVKNADLNQVVTFILTASIVNTLDSSMKIYSLFSG